MNKETKLYLADALTGMAAVHDKELPAAAIGIWSMALEEYSLDDLRKAFNQHARTSKWMPKPSDIIDIIEGKDETTLLEIEGAAEKGFAAALRSIGAVGRYNTPRFDDPRVSRAIELMGGWQDFCDMTDREEPFERKRFIALYRRAWQTGDGPGKLSGSLDRREEIAVPCGNGEQKLLEEPLDPEFVENMEAF